MLGADEWKQAVFLCSPGSCSDAVGYDTRNWLDLWIRFPKVGFGENTQTRVITARSCNKNLCFMVSLMQLRRQTELQRALYSAECVISII